MGDIYFNCIQGIPYTHYTFFKTIQEIISKKKKNYSRNIYLINIFPNFYVRIKYIKLYIKIFALNMYLKLKNLVVFSRCRVRNNFSDTFDVCTYLSKLYHIINYLSEKSYTFL